MVKGSPGVRDIREYKTRFPPIWPQPEGVDRANGCINSGRLSRFDKGVWIGAVLLILALALGIIIGVEVMRPIHERRVKELTLQRDAAEIEAAFWRARTPRAWRRPWTAIGR